MYRRYLELGRFILGLLDWFGDERTFLGEVSDCFIKS